MTFNKLTDQERAEWQVLPATKAAIESLRMWSELAKTNVLIAVRKGDIASAAHYGGVSEAHRVAADQLEAM